MIHLKIIPNTPKFQKRFQELVGDYDVAKTTASMPHPCSSEDAESFIGSIQNPTSLYKTLGIYQDHKLVGVIQSLDGSEVYSSDVHAEKLKKASILSQSELEDPQIRVLNIGYWIGKDYWGQGITTKALGLFLKHLRSQRAPSERVFIFGEHMQSNPISGKILKRGGMTPVLEYVKAWRGEDTLTVRYERVLE